MFTAMVLACAFNPDGTANRDRCSSYVAPYVWETEEICMASLQYGIAQVDQKGLAIIDYQCFDWKTKKGKSL